MPGLEWKERSSGSFGFISIAIPIQAQVLARWHLLVLALQITEMATSCND
jgi:hypothetical protein